jgi:ABC-type oligopeptide transport system substrate-binding subunit
MPLAVVLGAAIAVTLGCRPAETGYFGTTTPRHPPNELWINNAGEPEWLDPNRCADGNGGEIIWNTFAGLVQAHPATLEPMPEIATRWDVSADRQTYTFHLRPSQWSDGTPLTAHDFVFSFRRLVDPKTGSKYATNGHIFKGGAAVGRGAAPPESLGVRAVDDLTLVVELEDPLPYVLSFLTFYSFMPIPRHLLASSVWMPAMCERPTSVIPVHPPMFSAFKPARRANRGCARSAPACRSPGSGAQDAITSASPSGGHR